MAWGFASYCGALAAAGARHLDVPFYVNAWLGPQPGQDLPGRYPSGGPVAGVVDVWKAAAPTLALLGPDIYADDVKAAVAGYVREDNALLVPESRPAVGNLMWAVGRGAIGFNVFGVDDVRAAAYRLLAGAEEVIVAAQRSGCIRPVLLEAGQTAVVGLGGLTWTLRGSAEVLRSMFLDAGVQVRTEAGPASPRPRTRPWWPRPPTRAMAVLVDLGDDELLAIGQGLMFEVAGAPGEVVEIDDAVEGRYEAGAWVSGRNLNGDERLNLLPLDRPAAVRIRVLRRRVWGGGRLRRPGGAATEETGAFDGAVGPVRSRPASAYSVWRGPAPRGLAPDSRFSRLHGPRLSRRFQAARSFWTHGSDCLILMPHRGERGIGAPSPKNALGALIAFVEYEGAVEVLWIRGV